MWSARALLAVTVAVLVAACGARTNVDEVAAQAPDGAIVVRGTDNLRFEPDELTVDAGEVAFALACGSVNHNLVLLELEVEVAVCQRGELDTGTVTLEPGELTFVCTVPGHERTMRGTITVG